MWKDHRLKGVASAYGSSLKIREKLNVHVGVSGFVRRIDQHGIKTSLVLCQDALQPGRWAEWWRASGYGSKDFFYRRKKLGRERLHLRTHERVNPLQTLSLVGRCPRQIIPTAFLVFSRIVVWLVQVRVDVIILIVLIAILKQDFLLFKMSGRGSSDYTGGSGGCRQGWWSRDSSAGGSHRRSSHSADEERDSLAGGSRGRRQ